MTDFTDAMRLVMEDFGREIRLQFARTFFYGDIFDWLRGPYRHPSDKFLLDKNLNLWHPLLPWRVGAVVRDRIAMVRSEIRSRLSNAVAALRGETCEVDW